MGEKAIRMVDTSDQDDVILVFEKCRARTVDDVMGERFARIVRDLVMGVPVAASELHEFDIMPIGLFTQEQADEFEAQGQLPLH